MSRKNRNRQDQRHVEEDMKPEVDNVFPIQSGKKIEGLGKQKPFGQLKPGDRFQFLQSGSTPKGESPIFQKIETGRVDESDPLSDLCNYTLLSTGFKAWLPFVLPIIPID